MVQCQSRETMLILTVLPLKRGNAFRAEWCGTKHWRIGALATNETLNIVEASPISPISNGLNREDSCCSAAFGLTVTDQSKNQKDPPSFWHVWFWDVWNVWNAWHVWHLELFCQLTCLFFFSARLTSHPDLGRSRGWPSCVHWWIRQRCLGWFRKCFLIEEGVLRCKFQSFCSKCGVALVLILETWQNWILVWRDWRDVQNLDFLNIERWARLQEELELILDSNWKAFRSTEATQCVIFLLVHIRLCRYKKAMPHI